MTVAAILLAILIGVGVVLYIHHRIAYGGERADDKPENETTASDDFECCGMHITCEKDSLVAGIDAELLYYDDEELDEYRGRGAQEYSAEEIEMFRDVLLTLKPEDIAGWARSITARGITMPAEVREELLMIVSEARGQLVNSN